MTSAPLIARFYSSGNVVFQTDLPERVEMGRQNVGEPPPFCRTADQNGPRIVMAGIDERDVSRRHVRLEWQNGALRVQNISGTIPVYTETTPLAPREERAFNPPVLLTLGKIAVRVEAVEPEEDDAAHGLASVLQTLAEPSLPPGQYAPVSVLEIAREDGSVEPSQMLRWLRSAMDVLQSAASSPDFLAQAARTTVELVGLDAAAAMRWEQGEWRVAAQYITRPELTMGWKPSLSILEHVRQEKRTFRENPNPSLPMGSLMGVHSLVAAPILDLHGNVLGALYGDRRQQSNMIAAPVVTPLEAGMVELLASGVAAGLARVKQEQAALTARVQFEQFMTAELARRFEADPGLLDGRDMEVSVLFCDIRGFSRISLNLGPSRTIPWLTHVMGAFSDCVLDLGGVLVDYTGDELMAMWAAPFDAHHAESACRAACQMLSRLPELNARWQKEVREPFGVGVGVNSGPALVGNVGTLRKFKYGPLGTTVNLASRVQGAVKYFNTPLLVTGATTQLLGGEFHAQRLGTIRTVNIAKPVDVFEVVLDPSPAWRGKQPRYQAALEHFESRRFLQAIRILGSLLEEYPDDGPTRLLLQRAVNALSIKPEEFDPVWELPGK